VNNLAETTEVDSLLHDFLVTFALPFAAQHAPERHFS
jgi:hypothetical protein